MLCLLCLNVEIGIHRLSSVFPLIKVLNPSIYSAEWSFGDNVHTSNSSRDYGLPELLCSDSHMVAL